MITTIRVQNSNKSEYVTILGTPFPPGTQVSTLGSQGAAAPREVLPSEGLELSPMPHTYYSTEIFQLQDLEHKMGPGTKKPQTLLTQARRKSIIKI